MVLKYIRHTAETTCQDNALFSLSRQWLRFGYPCSEFLQQVKGFVAIHHHAALGNGKEVAAVDQVGIFPADGVYGP